MNLQRYQKQIQLKEFGIGAQQKLQQAKVLVIGAGGLGCPALQYLAAAGTGTIGILDFDVVDISNLQRQTLYTIHDVGKLKAETAACRLSNLNPEIKINALPVKLENSNALSILSDYDLVIDGSDNFSTRYLVNDACVLLNKPLVYGAVMRFEGQAGVFNLEDRISGIKTNYRDLFPQPPAPDSAISCNDVGVLGVVPGIIGTMQATEAIKIITGVGKPLCNRIVSYHILNNTFYEFEIVPSNIPEAYIPKSVADFLNYDYERFCGIQTSVPEISVEEFDELVNKKDVCIIDVREKEELPRLTEFNCIQIPMSEFQQHMAALDKLKTLIVVCQTGQRSARAVQILRNQFPGSKAYSLAGGIVSWKKRQPTNKI